MTPQKLTHTADCQPKDCQPHCPAQLHRALAVVDLLVAMGVEPQDQLIEGLEVDTDIPHLAWRLMFAQRIPSRVIALADVRHFERWEGRATLELLLEGEISTATAAA